MFLGRFLSKLEVSYADRIRELLEKIREHRAGRKINLASAVRLSFDGERISFNNLTLIDIEDLPVVGGFLYRNERRLDVL